MQQENLPVLHGEASKTLVHIRGIFGRELWLVHNKLIDL
jgi:hypothetical protein